LNGKGQTVVLVTHNRSNAERATRWIHLRDGRISRDSRNADGEPPWNILTAREGNRRTS
jgi:ABC-type lipoprotein export system ATPase subunit